MVTTEPIQARRQRLRERTDCRFVDSDEFCQLLLGFKKLVRVDDSALKVRGLLDIETGAQFFIEQEKLLPPHPHHA